MARRLSALLFLLVLTGCTASPMSAPSDNTPPQSSSPAQATPPASATTPAPGAVAPQAPKPADGAQPQVQDGVRELAWSPDGQRLALLTSAGLAVEDLAQRGVVTRWPVSVGLDDSLAGWRFDGKAIYLHTADNALLEVTADGPSREVVPAPPKDGRFPFVGYVPSPAGPVIARAWSGGKFQLIGAEGAWDGQFSGWSPTGQYLVYVIDKDTHLVEVSTEKNTDLHYLGPVIWQPGGARYLLLRETGAEVVSLKGEPTIKLPPARQADWSADGSRIVYQDGDGLWTVNADGKNRQLLRAGKDAPYAKMVWLAQDEIVYTSASDHPWVPFLITGGQAQPMPGSAGVAGNLYFSPDKRHVAELAGKMAMSPTGTLVVYP